MKSAPKPKKHPAVNVALQIWSSYRWTLLWYWIIFVVFFVVINIILRNVGVEDAETMNAGIWAGGGSSPKIFLLVIGILLTPVSLAGFVSSGVTRKHFSVGATLLIVSMSLLCSLIFMAGFPIERMVADWFGYMEQLDHPSLFRAAVEQFFLFTGYFGMGWMIGTGFYRYNWRIGIIISLLSFVPVTIMEMVAGSIGFMKFLESVVYTPEINLGLTFILFAVITVAIITANYLMLRKAPIKRKIF